MTVDGAIRLILARHGNTFEDGQKPVQVGARTDMPLTQEGKNQAHRLGRHLVSIGVKPKGVYAGPLKRQIETAEIVRVEVNAENAVHTHVPALVEIDYGLWEELTIEQIVSQWPREYSEWTEKGKWPEEIFGGSLEGHIEAIENWLNMLRKKYKQGDSIVGISSNGVLRFFFMLQKQTWDHLVMESKIDSLKVKTGHFCDLLLYGDRIEIVGWNLSVMS